MRGREGLLEHLVLINGNDYLSDLRINRNWVRPIKLLKDPERFSIQQWEETVFYLVEEKKTFSSAIEAKNFLLNWNETHD